MVPFPDSPGKDSPDIAPAYVPETLEKVAAVGRQRTQLRIGVPREGSLQENRVALTPRSVGVLVANGHHVFVESKAGEGAQFPDRDYSENGAQILYSAQEVFTRADIIAKIAPLSDAELEYLRPQQTVISAVHIGQAKKEWFKALMAKSVTAIGFEYIQAVDGSVPFMQIMSMIAGRTSVHIAAELLSVPAGGQGLLFGGITGVPPVRTAIIGAGTVGTNATAAAIALGCSVRIIDEEVPQLLALEKTVGRKLYTAVAQPDIVAEAVAWADVVIGAAFIKGYRAPVVVTEDMVMDMRDNSVIIDVAIDQGGCIETSRLTDHRNPTFREHGVIHYCVPNIASRVARTGSMAISNLLAPLLLKLGHHGGVKQSVGRETSIRSGIYVYHKHITQRALATLHDLNFMDIDLLYAVDL